tara:strand:- start:17944 stop:18153 length:210 start_codon:yes stop_codon:yes gene_type:complete
MARKHRQCPHCKSKKGFKYQYQMLGSGEITMDFNGNEIDHERNPADDVDDDVECLECGKRIEIDKVETD